MAKSVRQLQAFPGITEEQANIIITQHEIVLQSCVTGVELDEDRGRALKTIKNALPRAFHKCTIPWLASKEEPKLPRFLTQVKMNRNMEYVTYLDKYGNKETAMKKLSIYSAVLIMT